jgi:hypothetical protein
MTNQNNTRWHLKLVAVLWFLLGLYDLFLGYYNLYIYSQPGVFWLYMVPPWITFTSIFSGAFCWFLSYSIFSGTNRYLSLTIPFVLLVSIYIVVDYIKIGIDFIPDSGGNILQFILGIVTIKFSKLKFNKEDLRNPALLAMLVIGLSPYGLPNWYTYDKFSFLHKSFDQKQQSVEDVPKVEVQSLIDRFNQKYLLEGCPTQGGKCPLVVFLGYSSDTLTVRIDEAGILTQQMGTYGADEFLKILTNALTEPDSIQYIKMDFEEGDHAVPGVYSRSDFIRKFEND